MEIYKVTPKGKELPKELKNKPFYFTEKRTAEAFIKFCNKIINADIKWSTDLICVLNHKETYTQLINAFPEYANKCI